MEKGKIIGLVAIIIVIGSIAYLFFSSETAKDQVPSYISSDMKAMYEWAKTPEGSSLLEKIPCYCGCKYEKHKNAKNCFWTDDGKFDKHGLTCSVCFDIAKKTREMYEQGKDICEIRKAIDKFYEPNKELGTDTPMPEGCAE